MSTRLKPIGNRLLVRVDKPTEKTKGGILLPERAQERPRRGEVLALGKGKLLENGSYAAIEVQKGDVVLFGPYSGSEVPGDASLMILTTDEILGVVE